MNKMYRTIINLFDLPIEQYTKEDISRLLSIHIDCENVDIITSKFSTIMRKISHTMPLFYEKLRNKVSDLLEYYTQHNKSFADYLRSIICLSTIYRIYTVDLGESFDSYDNESIMKLAPPEFQYETRPDRLYYLLRNSRNRYTDIYDEICTCSAWDITEYNQMMTYIIDNKQNTYHTLTKLAGDHNACFNYKPLQVGVQSTAEMVLVGGHSMPYDKHQTRTPEIKTLIDTIHSIKTSDNLKTWKQMTDLVREYLITTFSEQLIWDPFGKN